MDRLLVDLFLESYRNPPQEIWLDLDATDDPLHGQQEGRFFHGYYRCYCYLPLYIFSGEHLLCARLRTADNYADTGGTILTCCGAHLLDPHKYLDKHRCHRKKRPGSA